MTQEIHSIGAMRVWSESSFATDGTGTLANYSYVPFNEGSASITLTTDEIDPNYTVTSRFEDCEYVNGKRSASMSFTVNLTPTGVAALSGVTAVQGSLGLMLKAVMGGEHLGTGTTFTSGCTASVLNVTSSAGLAVGGLIGWTNASGLVEYREIESIATNVVTVKHEFSAAPAATNVAIAAATYYYTENPTETLQFLVEGSESNDRWLLLGGQCVGGIATSVDPSGAALPTVTFNFTFADYKHSDETTGAVTGDLDDATFTRYEPIVAYTGEVRVFDVGTATLDASSLVHVSAFEFTPKISYVPVPSIAGTNGIYAWRAGRAKPPVEGSFTTFFEDLTWFDARDARTPKHIQYQGGQTAGYSFVLTAPTVTPSNPNRAAGGEIASQTVAWRGRRDTDVGSTATELAKSPVRIHLA